MSEGNAVVGKWEEAKALVAELELDVQKNAKGNAAAGVRARKGLRTLRTKVTELVKLTVELDKGKKADKADAKTEEKPAAS